MSVRRQSTLKRTRHTAGDTSSAPHSDHLEQRVAVLEDSCARFEQHTAELHRSIVALQAQLDHFFAKADGMAFRPTDCHVGTRAVDGAKP